MRLLALALAGFCLPAPTEGVDGWTKPYASASADRLDLTYAAAIRGKDGAKAGVVGVDTGTVKSSEFDVEGMATAVQAAATGKMARICSSSSKGDMQGVLTLLMQQWKVFAKSDKAMMVYIGCESSGDFFSIARKDEGLISKIRCKAAFGDVKRRIFELKGDGTLGAKTGVDDAKYMTRERPWYRRGMEKLPPELKKSGGVRMGEGGTESWVRPYRSASGGNLDLTYSKALPPEDGTFTGAVGVDTGSVDTTEFDTVSMAKQVASVVGKNRAKFCKISDKSGFQAVATALSKVVDDNESPQMKMIYFGCEFSGAFYGIGKKDGKRIFKIRNKAVFGDKKRRVFGLEGGTIGEKLETEVDDYLTYKRPWYIMVKGASGSSLGAQGGWTKPYLSASGDHLDLTFVSPLPVIDGVFQGTIGIDTMTLSLAGQPQSFNAPGLAADINRRITGKTPTFCKTATKEGFAPIAKKLFVAYTRFKGPKSKGAYIGCEGTGQFYGVFDSDDGMIFKVRNRLVYKDKRRRIFKLRGGRLTKLVETEEKEYGTRGRPWYEKMKAVRAKTLKGDLGGTAKPAAPDLTDGDAVGWTEPYETASGNSLDLSYCAAVQPGGQGTGWLGGKLLGVIAVDTGTQKLRGPHSFDAPAVAKKVRESITPEMTTLCMIDSEGGLPGPIAKLDSIRSQDLEAWRRKKEESGPFLKMLYFGCVENGDFYGVANKVVKVDGVKNMSTIAKIRNAKVFGDQKRRIFEVRDGKLGALIETEEKEYATRERPWYVMVKLMVQKANMLANGGANAGDNGGANNVANGGMPTGPILANGNSALPQGQLAGPLPCSATAPCDRPPAAADAPVAGGAKAAFKAVSGGLVSNTAFEKTSRSGVVNAAEKGSYEEFN